MNFDDFLISISKIKNIPLPAESSQFKMAPTYRRVLMEQQKEAIKNAKQAGVLALFYPNKHEQTTLVLILRKAYMGVHSAQIGFPGGKLEKDDASLEAAAIRETHEEVGVPVANIEVFCELSGVYIPPSNFYVKPFMGVSKKKPYFVLQEDEVEAIIEVSLQHILDDTTVVIEKVNTSYSIEVDVPAFNLNGHIVWGATAMMLSEIKDMLKQLL